MKQKNRQRRHKDDDYARFDRRPKITIKISPDKIPFNIRKYHDQHVDDQHDPKAVEKLHLHIFYGHIPVTHQPEIASGKIAYDKTKHIRQQQNHILNPLS